jgi:signal transduction histidine kinase
VTKLRNLIWIGACLGGDGASFYQTWWFILACVSSSVLCLWIIFRLRLRSIARTIRAQAEERADERVRLARDLHDTLLQGVQGLMLRFHAAARKAPPESDIGRQLDSAMISADQILLEARDHVSRLRHNDPAHVHLADAFIVLAADLNYEKKVGFSIDVDGGPVELPEPLREELYFIGREAITNAFRHSEASEISVAIIYSGASIKVIVRDNGCGFHPTGPAIGKTGHRGLLGMMERAHKIGATFDCRSAPGTGTIIEISLTRPHEYLSRLKAITRRLARFFNKSASPPSSL